MDNKKTDINLPRLRFPGFDGAWTEKRIKDCLKERNEQYPTSVDYPLMAFIADKGVAPKGERYDRSALVKDVSGKRYKRTEKGDFIYSSNNLETGSIGLNRYGNACISPVYSIFEPKESVDPAFIGSMLTRKSFISELVNYRQGVVYGQWKIPEQEFLNLCISIPSLPEQRKIAGCLAEIDEMIQCQDLKVESLKQHKWGLIHQLFPQQGNTLPAIRFPGFSSEWVEVTIGDVFNLRNGYTPSKSEESFWSDGKLAWFRMDDIREKGHILYDSAQHITESAVKGNKLFEANTIIVATSATIGEHALIRVKHLANQRFVNLSIKDSYLSKTNIEYAYQFMFIVDEICKSKVNVGAFASISTEVFSGLPYLMPSLEEQRVITGCLSAIDDVIDLEEKKAKSLKQLKKGLVQNLFPL